MKLFSLLPLLGLAAARNIRIDQIEYGFCEGADESVGSPDIIDVQPFPVVVATGETITLTIQVTSMAAHDVVYFVSPADNGRGPRDPAWGHGLLEDQEGGYCRHPAPLPGN